MKLSFQIKTFDDLNTTELYAIMQLRSEVFVVEQNCVYQDLDGKDQKSRHILGYLDTKLVAYCRIFDKADYFEEASIGRVLVAYPYRKQHFGHELMCFAIAALWTCFESKKCTISAQLYLKHFYESHGFVQVGNTYLEDNIPHIMMRI
jgi:ElaA protein